MTFIEKSKELESEDDSFYAELKKRVDRNICGNYGFMTTTIVPLPGQIQELMFENKERRYTVWKESPDKTKTASIEIIGEKTEDEFEKIVEFLNNDSWDEE